MSFKKIKTKHKQNINKSLTQKSFIGFIWTFTGVGGQAILQVVVLMVLARFLSPEDFGVTGAAIVVTQFANIFSELGVGPAIIQRKDLNEKHLRVGFTLSLGFGICVSLLIYSSAPIIADFFKIKQLNEVLNFYSLVFILKGFSSLSEALLQRHLKFKVMTSIELMSYFLGYACVSVVMGIQGYGYWAIVGGHLAQSSIKAIGVMVLQPHSMKPLMNRRIVKELFYFGSGHTIARIANFTANQGDNLVIGRILGVEALGNYGRAYQLVVMPANLFGQVFDKVLFPAMSQVQDDAQKLAAAYRKCISIISWVIIPFSIFVSVLAPEIINLVLGNKWISLVIPFQVLSIGLLFRVVHKISDALARSKGAVYKRAWRQCVYALLVLAGAWFGCRWGIEGVAIGVLCAIFINYLLMAHLCRTLSDLSSINFIMAHIPGVLLGMVLCPSVYYYTKLLRILSSSDAVIIVSNIALILVMITLLCKLFPSIFLRKDNHEMLLNCVSFIPEKIRKILL